MDIQKKHPGAPVRTVFWKKVNDLTGWTPLARLKGRDLFYKLFEPVIEIPAKHEIERGPEKGVYSAQLFLLDRIGAKRLGMKKAWLEAGMYVIAWEKPVLPEAALLKYREIKWEIPNKNRKWIAVPKESDLKKLYLAILLECYKNASEQELKSEGLPLASLVAREITQPAGKKFFGEVARRSGQTESPANADFIAEVFAYGGRMVLLSKMLGGEVEAEMGKLPANIEKYLERRLCA